MRKLTHEELSGRRLRQEEIPNARRLPVIALADDIRSLYNVGSIFRTSDGAFIEQVILTGYTPSPPRKEIEKTALGSTKTVPWKYVKDPLTALEDLRSKGYNLVSLELTDSSTPYTEVTRNSFPLCLIIGNEVVGVSKKVLSLCDFSMDIPMHGSKHSLNVAVAYGIALFELSRIWRAMPAH